MIVPRTSDNPYPRAGTITSRLNTINRLRYTIFSYRALFSRLRLYRARLDPKLRISGAIVRDRRTDDFEQLSN